MKIIDIVEEASSALLSNRVRSGLTILGIVIGIGSVIAMLSIGQGVQSSIASSIQSIGSNLVIVMPGAQRGPGTAVSAGRGSAKSLTLDDATAIATQVSSVKAVAPEVSSRYQVTAKGQNTNTTVDGTSENYPDVRNAQVDDGVFISVQDVNSDSKVAVLGSGVRDDLFGTDATGVVDQIIRINKIEFKVIGVLKAKGGGGFGSQDDEVFIPISTDQRYLSGNEYVSTISVSAVDANSTTAVQQGITDLLDTRHHITSAATADFSTMNQADVTAAASSTTQLFTILLGSIAGISLLVGGIGIMNMMLMTVTERTREIGLRKAIGAKKKDISLEFLTEAVALTLVSGIFGVIFGWGVSWLVTYFGSIQTQVTWSSVLLAFGVSALIGILFGYYPARRAAGLNPIEALRYE